MTLAKVAKMLGVEIALETYTFPATLSAAPEPTVPIPTKPEVPNIAAVFVTPATFMETVAKTLGAERAFDTYAFPATLRVAPEPTVPIPTNPDVPKMAEVFVTPVTFIETVAKTLGVESALETNAFPATLSAAPDPTVPIPTKPDVPKMDAVLTTAEFMETVANTFGAEIELDA